MSSSPFDHRQDRELGDALRVALSGKDEAEFVETVMARVADFQNQTRGGSDWWEILSGWARPGLAAATAGVVAAAVLWWIGIAGVTETETSLPADPLRASAEIPAVFLTSQAPDLNEVLAIELGN